MTISTVSTRIPDKGRVKKTWTIPVFHLPLHEPVTCFTLYVKQDGRFYRASFASYPDFKIACEVFHDRMTQLILAGTAVAIREVEYLS